MPSPHLAVSAAAPVVISVTARRGHAGVVLKIVDGVKEVVRRIRRRGKELIRTAYVAGTNEHNEYGLVQVVREHPFRSASSDVGQAACRCNLDFRIMARGIPEASADRAVLRIDDQRLGAAFRGVPLRRLDEPSLRRMVRSVVALHVAAHNCDFYITKYAAKAMAHLQNVVT